MALLSPRSTMNAREDGLICDITCPDLLVQAQRRRKRLCSHAGVVDTLLKREIG